MDLYTLDLRCSLNNLLYKDTITTIKTMKMKQFFIIFVIILSFCRCTSLNDGFLQTSDMGGLVPYDSSLPALTNLSIESDHSFFFEFDKEIDIISAQFILSGEGANKTMLTNSKKNIFVEFKTPMFPDTEYKLVWKGIKSLTGDYLSPDSILFTIESDSGSPDEIPTIGAVILFNEILFNPQSGGSEYIELYNKADYAIDLSTLCLDKYISGRVIHYPLADVQHNILSKGYALLTKSKKGVDLYFDLSMDMPIYEMAKFPQLSNEEGSYAIHSRVTGEVFDALHYTKHWHTIPQKDTKGVSLERISFNAETDDLDNWRSADQTTGGTPGYPNNKGEIDPDGGGDDGGDDNINPEEGDSIDTDCIIPEGIKAPILNAKGDRYQVYYHLHQAGYSARVTLFDINGKAVASLPIKEKLPMSGYLTWGVLNVDGERFRSGVYIFYVDFFHETGATLCFKRAFAIL